MLMLGCNLDVVLGRALTVHKSTVDMQISSTCLGAGASEGVRTFFNSTLSTCLPLQQYAVSYVALLQMIVEATAHSE